VRQQMAGPSGPIGGPHFGTMPEKPTSYAGLYKYTVQAPGLEGKSALGQA